MDIKGWVKEYRIDKMLLLFVEIYLILSILVVCDVIIHYSIRGFFYIVYYIGHFLGRM